MFNKNNILPIQVILNGTNISNMYNSIQGYDKLSRIHELYNGIITPRNEKDINGIKIGLLNSKCFDLKTLKGININIDNLVGDKVDIPYEYLEYLKKIFRNKYEYTGDINLTRDELLKIILNKPKKTSKNSVLIKKLS